MGRVLVGLASSAHPTYSPTLLRYLLGLEYRVKLGSLGCLCRLKRFFFL